MKTSDASGPSSNPSGGESFSDESVLMRRLGEGDVTSGARDLGSNPEVGETFLQKFVWGTPPLLKITFPIFTDIPNGN